MQHFMSFWTARLIVRDHLVRDKNQRRIRCCELIKSIKRAMHTTGKQHRILLISIDDMSCWRMQMVMIVNIDLQFHESEAPRNVVL